MSVHPDGVVMIALLKLAADMGIGVLANMGLGIVRVTMVGVDPIAQLKTPVVDMVGGITAMA